MKIQQKAYPTFFQEAKVDERVRLFIEEITGFPPNSNPFHHDHFRMGADVTKDIQAMYSTPRKGFATTDLRLIRTATGQCFSVVTIPEDPTPLPAISLSSWTQGESGLGMVAWNKSSGDHIVPVMAQYLGGGGLENIHARTDDLSGPLMFDSQYGQFVVPLYFYHGSTAILVAAIPQVKTPGRILLEGENYLDTNDIVRVMEDHGYMEKADACRFAEAASEFFTANGLTEHNRHVFDLRNKPGC